MNGQNFLIGRINVHVISCLIPISELSTFLKYEETLSF